MKKKLTNNLFLKIISVVIAIFVWLLIVNINDPMVTKSYNIPVTIQNDSYIESIGKTFRVEELQRGATVILRGKSSVVEGRGNDIQAVADLTQIVDMDTKPYVMVPITVTCDRILPENINVVPKNLRIVIEEAVEQDFVIGVDTDMTIPAREYRIGKKVANPEIIKIKGPSSLMKKIDSVVAVIDVKGMSKDAVKKGELKVYDKNKDILSDIQMGYLKFGENGEPRVDVTIDLWRVQPDVELKVNYSGSPGVGYQVDKISVTPEKIGVAGTEEALAQLKENNNTIEINEEEITLDGKTQDFEIKVDLNKFLPPETKLAGDVESAIVNVSILPLESKQFKVPTQDIEVMNLDEDRYRLVFGIDKMNVRVKGEADPLTKVNEKTVKPVIDLAGLDKGDHMIPVQFSLPEGCEILEEVKVLVHITEK